jgi:hypothetical protein
MEERAPCVSFGRLLFCGLCPMRLETILAILLWGGVTIFIFGILIDVIR